jgi:transcriptional regulator with XRE-family HTH domain
LTDGIGLLRAIRLQKQLSLRDVEEQSFRLAQEWGDEAYRISASWLDRLEREEHEMSLSTLVVLANIYNLPADQLLRSVSPGSPHPVGLHELSVPNATLLLTEGSFEELARYPLPGALGQDRTPEHTTVLPADNGILPAQFGRGVIGKYDRILDPMVGPGSIV